MDITRVSVCSFSFREQDKNLDYAFKAISESGFDKIGLVARIDVSQEGKPLLEVNPEGLLSSVGCIKVVTPREVLRKIKLRGKVYRLDV